jgi:hypothetical protein
MKRFAPVALVALLLVGCKSPGPGEAGSSQTTAGVTPSASPSPSPSLEPDKALPVTMRGAYRGACDLVKTNFHESLKHQSIRWKFRSEGHKIALFSKTGGYTMLLTRTAKAKFYGSVTTGGWQYAYTVTASDIQDNGLATTLHVVTHDTATGGSFNDTSVCDLTLA